MLPSTLALSSVTATPPVKRDDMPVRQMDEQCQHGQRYKRRFPEQGREMGLIGVLMGGEVGKRKVEGG